MDPSFVNTAETAPDSPKRAFRNPLDVPIALIAVRLGGRKSKELERFLKFAVVGVTGAVVDFGMLIFLQATFLPPGTSEMPRQVNVALATSIAFISAVVSNFTWTRLWVYPESRGQPISRQLAQFTLISVSGGVLRSIWVTIMTFRLGHVIMPIVLPIIHMARPEYIATPEGETKLGSIVAQLIGMAVIMLWNFFANRYWTYRHVK